MSHITECSWSFFAYLAALDNPSHRMDHLVPFFMAMMLQCKITIYTGKEIWNSNDSGGGRHNTSFGEWKFPPYQSKLLFMLMHLKL